ncbi:MAG: ATP-binding protein [Rhizobiaceae bacterium]
MALLIDLQKQQRGEQPLTSPSNGDAHLEKAEAQHFRKKTRKTRRSIHGFSSELVPAVLVFACILLIVTPALLKILDHSITGYEFIFSGSGILLLFAILLARSNSQPANPTDVTLKVANEKLVARLESLEDQAWEVRESEEIHRSLAEIFGDVVINRNQQGAITFSNAIYTKYFDETHNIPSLKNTETSPLESNEIELDTLLGTRWFTWTDLSIRDQKSGDTGWRSVARDITEQKNHERGLVDALKKAEVANEAKSQFLAMVSHEIRTPLNGVIGMAKLLADTELQPAQKNYVEAVQLSGKTLLGLIENLLDTAQIEAGHVKLNVGSTKLTKLVEEVAEILNTSVRKKNLSLATYIDPTIPAVIAIDGDKVRQVLLNLVGNAVKFTEKGGVSLHLHHKGHGKIEVEVADTGPGLSVEDQTRIFDAFIQTDTSSTRDHGGTGLGLSISQKLVSMMGDEIKVESKLGTGSQFKFVLNYAAIENQESAVSFKLENHTLALILPKTPARKALSNTALSMGCKIEAFDGLPSFLSKPSQGGKNTSIIISYEDASTGLSCLKQLRQSLGEDSKLILIGNADQQVEILQMIEAGYNGWLTWPVRAATLYNVLVGQSNIPHSPLDQAPLDKKQLNKAQKDIEIALPKTCPSLRILVAEDNPINALLAKSLLKKMGHAVDHVENGEKAVQALLLEAPYDLIFMDLHMPVQDGESAIQEIRESEQLAGVPPCPIVVLSADGQSAARERAIAAGADDFLIKPLDLDSVTTIVDTIAANKFATL